MADYLSFLDFIFILFYTRLLDFSLTIVNSKCFLVQKIELHEHISHSACKKYKQISNSDSFFSFFVQNEFNFNKNKAKVAYLSHTFNKKK